MDEATEYALKSLKRELNRLDERLRDTQRDLNDTVIRLEERLHAIERKVS